MVLPNKTMDVENLRFGYNSHINNRFKYFMRLTNLFVLALLLGVALNITIRPTQIATYECEGSVGITFDFECGCLSGWTVEGDAFKFQPTLGDNPTARNRGMPSKHVGNYWIGGFENYTSTAGTPGATAGDGLTGTLTSRPFKIFSNNIQFLIGGGASYKLRVELVKYPANRTLWTTWSPGNTQSMYHTIFDVRQFIGTWVFLRAVDQDTGDWGHLNFDNFKFTY